MIDREQRATFTAQLHHRRRRGRPRTTPRIRTTVALPEDVFDALCRQALLERKSLHALVCETLTTRAR